MTYKSQKYNSLSHYISSSYEVNQENECWEWSLSIRSDGYGNAWWNGKHYFAHRLSFLSHVGNLEQDICVLHRCDNRKCINPEHLFLGSYLDNNRDRKNKGRNAVTHGERNPFSKLKEYQVIDILRRLKCGEKGRCIASLYNVSEHTISKIKHGINWTYLTGENYALSQRPEGKNQKRIQ